MRLPSILICAGKELFTSFLTAEQQKRLSRISRWQRDESREVTPQLKRRLADADALVTTWDSPKFGEDLRRLAPELRIISHCGGEVKSRFARPLFKSLTITAAPVPIARATAEFGVSLLLYCALNVHFLCPGIH